MGVPHLRMQAYLLLLMVLRMTTGLTIKALPGVVATGDRHLPTKAILFLQEIEACHHRVED
jgi:hypothetical protein